MRFSKTALVVLVLLSFSTQARSASEPTIGLGVAVQENEILFGKMTIFPDGRNLPDGSGTAERGEPLFKAKCAYCHGPTGKEGPGARLVGSEGLFSIKDPLRIVRIAKSPMLAMSVGGLWPYATTLFDFIRRAMPPTSPKNLTADEIYSITAYILYLNELIDKTSVVNKTSLPKVRMPAAEKTVLAWPENER